MSSDALRNRLLHILILKNTMAIGEAAEAMGSEKEVLYYINELNNLFSGKIRINITRDTNEIVLKIINRDSFFRELYGFGIHDFNDSRCRIAFLMKELIEKDDYLNIMDLSEHMNVSRGTVNNDLRKTKKYINKYNAVIEGVTNRGIKILCDEFNKRLMLIHEVFDYIPVSRYLSNSLIEDVNIISDYYGLNNSAGLLFFKTVIVTIYRAKQKKTLNKSIPMYKNFEVNNKEFLNFIDKIQNEYCIQLTREDIDFISFPINTRSSAYTDKRNNYHNEELLKDIVYKMVGSVKEKFMIHIDEEIFFSKVKYHLLFLINRLIFKIPLKDIFSNQIKIRFPLAFELAKISMNVLYEEYRLVGTKVDVGYLAVYLALILDERKSPDDEKRSRRAAVITNMGIGVFQLIKKQLLEILGLDTEIDLLTLQEFKTKDISSYGIIFTTENIISDIHMPLVHIGGIIDYSSLSKKISEIKGGVYNRIDKFSRVIDFNILEITNSNSYKDSVKKIVEHLSEQGYSTENIFGEYERKERISSMIYENGVAFPHLTAPNIRRLNLTLGIIKSKEENLKLIFFLLIPENIDKDEEKLLMKIYDEIFTIISDKSLISEIQGLTGEKDALKLLKERRPLI